MLPSLALLVFLPFLGSVVAAMLPTNARNLGFSLAGLIAVVCGIQVIACFPGIANGGVLREEMRWIPSLGLNFSIRVDGLAWLFALLVFGIGALVALYARYYMSPKDPVARFSSFFLAFMGSMAGVVLSGNLIQLALFWELTSIFSFLLIGYWYHRRDARRGARMSLIVTGAGGLCLLAGVLLIGHVVGSYDLDDVLESGDMVRRHALYPVILALVLLGAFTKSAQFPFHFWLPRAMAAPTPVSAYLHSATMVKAGIFLLARLWPVLSGTNEWFWLVCGAGVITLLLGGFTAMFQNDLKGLLAYSTISHLGLITLLLGLNSSLATVAALFHVINHATFKASLFMAAGIIDHEAGTRDIRKLNGLRRAMPITATLAMVASAAMAGVPLLNGFISKEMFFTETVFIEASPWISWGLPLAATIAGVFSVAYSLRFTVDVFFGPPAVDLPHEPHEPAHWMLVPIVLLVLLCLVIGMAPEASVGAILDAAALPAVGGTLPAFDLAIWHGWNLPLAMSIVALVGGLYFYLILRRQIKLGVFAGTPLIGWINGARLFDGALALLSWIAKRAVQFFGTTRLQSQLALMITLALVAGAAALWSAPTPLTAGSRPLLPFSGTFALFWLVGIACAFGAAWQAKYHRLASLAMLGGTGLITSLTFVWFSAPDLALTQLAVEVVTTVLILLGLRWLPKRVESSGQKPTLRARGRRLRDLAISVSMGGGLAVLSYAMMTRPFPQSIAPFYLQHALSEGGGTNVVNVMLVDFRGFDTLGEIVVLGVVALTVYALLRRFRPARESTYIPAQQSFLPADIASDVGNPTHAADTALGYLMIPAVLVRMLLPVATIVSFYLFMRGHNQPGGGFVAGLVFATAFILQYMVAGTQWVEAHMSLHPPQLIAFGLLAALATGTAAWVAGYPFLTSHAFHLHLPVVGDIHVASALFFDIGVYSLVIGATILILTALAHQSVRGRRVREAQVEERFASTAPISTDEVL